jgi:hypothetical protein
MCEISYALIQAKLPHQAKSSGVVPAIGWSLLCCRLSEIQFNFFLLPQVDFYFIYSPQEPNNLHFDDSIKALPPSFLFAL